MPFVLVIAGILMIVTGAQGTYSQFATQVGKDFTGPGNFVYWVASIGAIGAVGYVESLQTISRLLIGLVIIAMVLSNKGFFAKFQAALNAGPTTPQPGLALGSTAPSGSYVTPSQGVQQGNKGVGVDWTAPFKKFFGG